MSVFSRRRKCKFCSRCTDKCPLSRSRLKRDSILLSLRIPSSCPRHWGEGLLPPASYPYRIHQATFPLIASCLCCIHYRFCFPISWSGVAASLCRVPNVLLFNSVRRKVSFYFLRPKNVHLPRCVTHCCFWSNFWNRHVTHVAHGLLLVVAAILSLTYYCTNLGFVRAAPTACKPR